MRVGLPRGAVGRSLITPFVRRACKDDDVELLCAIHTHLYIADSDDMRAELAKEPNAARRQLADLLHVTLRPKRTKYRSGEALIVSSMGARSACRAFNHAPCGKPH
jgi:hypothetical protein